MPLRRRPQEPSPRLLALLGEGQAARAGDGAGGRPARTGRDLGLGDAARTGASPADHARDGERGARDAAAGPGATDGESRVEPWLPDRQWLEAGAGRPPPPDAAPGRAPQQPGRHRRPTPPGPALLTLPRALRGARTSGPRAAALGLVLVVVAAAVVFGVRVAWAAAASAPQPVASRPDPARGSAVAERTTSPGGFGATGTPGAPAAPASSTQLVVHVVGQVRRPGVVVLPAAARVRDAVARAGGALPSADLGAVNLARPLADGEQLRIPRPGEAPPASTAPSASGGAPAGGGGTGAGGLVNLNTATQSVLEELPGVGPVLAQRIIDWRTEHGRFTSVDELAEVSGIGEKMFAQLQGKVTV